MSELELKKEQLLIRKLELVLQRLATLAVAFLVIRILLAIGYSLYFDIEWIWTEIIPNINVIALVAEQEEIVNLNNINCIVTMILFYGYFGYSFFQKNYHPLNITIDASFLAIVMQFWQIILYLFINIFYQKILDYNLIIIRIPMFILVLFLYINFWKRREIHLRVNIEKYLLS